MLNVGNIIGKFFKKSSQRELERLKLAIDKSPFYKNKKVIFSNSNVAGEGEHKILKYIKQTDIDGNIINKRKIILLRL